MFKEEVINDRLSIFRNDKIHFLNSFEEDVRNGLTSEKKFLLPKYFYDERGSELFEKICSTKEYYPTRSETEILDNLSDTISERNIDKNMIVELGSGTSVKTELLIRSFLKERNELLYIPLDVSNIIIESSRQLNENYSRLVINGVISFYEEGMEFIVSRFDSPKIILFLGSSIGNFTHEESIDLMRMLAKYMNETDRLLIGFDLVKETKILEDAYNDADGITAEFNLNILSRINRELNANFKLESFKHKAVFNKEDSRIEMYLESLSDMNVELKSIDEIIKLKKGELIHTENSYKFNKRMINELAERSGLIFSDYYTDEKEYFALCAFRLKGNL
ncbi:MAG TPA: L-histidine N(alpha)-methyltransferase [Ignavibacteria bacterium]|nr:L-histidine N(alpha)-methyltransferase [Ignavibacteria bacterium]HMR39311.1 L-histidine N(alpha)-methyltransferase [Ignavibacteria bacterium]